MSEAAYNLDYEERYEIIEGVKTFMPLNKVLEHSAVVTNLIMIFGNYLKASKRGLVFGNIDINFPDKKMFSDRILILFATAALSKKAIQFTVCRI